MRSRLVIDHDRRQIDMAGRRRERIEYIGELPFLLERAFGQHDDAARIAIEANAFDPEMPARDQANLQVFRMIAHEAVVHLLEPHASRGVRVVAAGDGRGRRQLREHERIVGHVGKRGGEALPEQLRRHQQAVLRFLHEHRAVGAIRGVAGRAGRDHADAREQQRQLRREAEPDHFPNRSGRSPDTMRLHSDSRRAMSSTG